METNSVLQSGCSTVLKPGYYVAGYDFAAGIVDIHVLRGSIGNLMSTNRNVGGIGEVISFASSDPRYYNKDFYGINMPRGTQLLVDCFEAAIVWNSDFSPILRTYAYDRSRVLTGGKYRVGTSIEPGFYDAELISGYANIGVFDQGAGRFNSASIGLQFEDDYPVPKFKNILLCTGDELEITDISMMTYDMLKNNPNNNMVMPDPTRVRLIKCTSNIVFNEYGINNFRIN